MSHALQSRALNAINELSEMKSKRMRFYVAPLVMRAILQVLKCVESPFSLDRSDCAQHTSGRNTIVTSVKEVNPTRHV